MQIKKIYYKKIKILLLTLYQFYVRLKIYKFNKGVKYMSILKRIKEFVQKIINHQPLIEGPKETTLNIDGFIAPKGQETDKDFIASLHVAEQDMVDPSVTFGELKKEELDRLLGVAEKDGRKLGWTHDDSPTITGKLNGEAFLSLVRKNVPNHEVGQTIFTENGRYEVRTLKDNSQQGSYEEHVTGKDGEVIDFSTDFGKNSSRVYNEISKNGVTLRESAKSAIMHGESGEFENYAQPSEDLLKEYAEATGLPTIMDSYRRSEMEAKTGLQMDDLCMTMRKEEGASFPYIVSIEASKKIDEEHEPKKKAVKYAYTSQEAYVNGEKPYMIYMDGIDGRTGFSGMFRLKGDSYVDNSTFRRENGEYKYDTISFEDIMKLVGKMQLSSRVDSAIRGKFRMPEGVDNIYNKAMSIDRTRTDPNQGIAL